ncbi:MAG: hypothetical protein ACP5TZ_03420 [Nitrososphaeria archaeon]
MVWDGKQEDHDSYNEHYHRRSIIEGIFSAVKRSQHIRSKLQQNQEAMCRPVIWNVLSMAYHIA